MFGKLKSTKDVNPQGIGLGLNVCKRIVSVFNGDMSCVSEKDKGSKFNFSFHVKEYHWNEEDSDGEGTEINIAS
jgi:K+-sensing histidine kinase KdpD